MFNLSNNNGSAFFPRIAQSLVNSSDVYVVWADNSTGNMNVFFKRSTDGGATFDKTINLSNDTNGFSLFPRIATSLVNSSDVYVVWADNSTGNGDIFFKKSTDGGATFDKTINLSNDTDYSSNPEISVFDALGPKDVYVVWQDKVSSISDNNTSLGNISSSNIFLKKSTDGGATFGNTTNLSQGIAGSATNPQISVVGSNVYVIWQDKTTLGNQQIIFWKAVSPEQLTTSTTFEAGPLGVNSSAPAIP
jgi:peroxiredoxin